jgi:transcriptional regulator with XRE-family HTH domain
MNETLIITLLKEEISERGISVRQAAREIDLSHTTLNRILAGESYDMSTAEKIAGWLNVPTSSLVDGTIREGEEDFRTVIAGLFEVAPELENVFREGYRRVQRGEMEPRELRELAYFAAYRMGIPSPAEAKEHDPKTSKKRRPVRRGVSADIPTTV